VKKVIRRKPESDPEIDRFFNARLDALMPRYKSAGLSFETAFERAWLRIGAEIGQSRVALARMRLTIREEFKSGYLTSPDTDRRARKKAGGAA
jgi:hypothetical protein